jgi:hypothetical protein
MRRQTDESSPFRGNRDLSPGERYMNITEVLENGNISPIGDI